MSYAQDVMDTEVVTIDENATIEEAIVTLLEHQISGAPVVDRDGLLVGIISEYQLLEAVYSSEVMKHHVHESMVKDVLTVTEETAIRDIANLFVVQRIHRVPVVRGKEVVGVVTRQGLLEYALDSATAEATGQLQSVGGK